MRSKPCYDTGLVQRAQKFATGAKVHDLAQKLTPYKCYHDLYDETPSDEMADMIAQSERQLRIFVTGLMLATIPKMAEGAGFAPAMAA